MTDIRASLEKDIAKALRGIAKGAPQFYRTKQGIMRRFVTDLASVKRLVPKLENVKRETFYVLVDFWRKNNHQTETIQRKISLLRKLMPVKEQVPTNAELNIKYTYVKKYAVVSQIGLCDITSGSAKNICSLQYYFGLKKAEAIRFHLIPYQEANVLISRKIAYNSIDRIVPLVSAEQEDFLKQFAAKYPSGLLTNYQNERLLSALHGSELNRLEIHDGEYFRYLYVKNRFRQLEETGVDHTKRLKQLRVELGYRENRQIREILKCHTKR